MDKHRTQFLLDQWVTGEEATQPSEHHSQISAQQHHSSFHSPQIRQLSGGAVALCRNVDLDSICFVCSREVSAGCGFDDLPSLISSTQFVSTRVFRPMLR